jgi:ribonucleoside-diphosphate reductase beta chain
VALASPPEFDDCCRVRLRPRTPAPSAPGDANLLDPGFNLTLRPMRYPQFYDMYRDAIRNTWTVEEVNLGDDVGDLQRKLCRPSGT